MPRTLIPLLAVALLAGCAAPARAQSGVRPTQTPATREEGGRALPSPDAETRKAEELCLRGEELAAHGPAQRAAALKAFSEGVRLYLGLYVREVPATGPGKAAGANFREAMRERLRKAPECVEAYLRVGAVTDPFERSQLEAFRAQVQLFRETDEERAAFLGTEVDERARIRRRPEPGFTEQARRAGVRGGVRLRAVLDRDGTVKHVFVLKGLPFGMSEECVEAAKMMSFTPAVRDGRPVSPFVTLEYNFNMY